MPPGYAPYGGHTLVDALRVPIMVDTAIRTHTTRCTLNLYHMHTVHEAQNAEHADARASAQIVTLEAGFRTPLLLMRVHMRAQSHAGIVTLSGTIT